MDGQYNIQKMSGTFCRHVGTYRPVVLLIDSVSSYVDMVSFEYAQQREIEMYQLLPNMQPLDVGVFGPLKATCK
jgi:hypothetical protein